MFSLWLDDTWMLVNKVSIFIDKLPRHPSPCPTWGCSLSRWTHRSGTWSHSAGCWWQKIIHQVLDASTKEFHISIQVSKVMITRRGSRGTSWGKPRQSSSSWTRQPEPQHCLVTGHHENNALRHFHEKVPWSHRRGVLRPVQPSGSAFEQPSPEFSSSPSLFWSQVCCNRGILPGLWWCRVSRNSSHRQDQWWWSW